jgi:hypothetical protein
MRERTPGVWEIVVQAGRDPAKRYSGCVTETDRALAAAVASLIAPPVDAG